MVNRDSAGDGARMPGPQIETGSPAAGWTLISGCVALPLGFVRETLFRRRNGRARNCCSRDKHGYRPESRGSLWRAENAAVRHRNPYGPSTSPDRDDHGKRPPARRHIRLVNPGIPGGELPARRRTRWPAPRARQVSHPLEGHRKRRPHLARTAGRPTKQVPLRYSADCQQVCQ